MQRPPGHVGGVHASSSATMIEAIKVGTGCMYAAAMDAAVMSLAVICHHCRVGHVSVIKRLCVTTRMQFNDQQRMSVNISQSEADQSSKTSQQIPCIYSNYLILRTSNCLKEFYKMTATVYHAWVRFSFRGTPSRGLTAVIPAGSGT